MRARIVFLICLVSAISYSNEFRVVSYSIYKNDDRKLVNISKYQTQAYDKIVVGQLKYLPDRYSATEIYELNPQSIKFNYKGKVIHKRLCKNERFSQYNTPFKCTGFFVDHNKILTAGHCVLRTSSPQNYCLSQKWTIGAIAENATNHIYRCKEIIKARYRGVDERGDKSFFYNEKLDYALIELESEQGEPESKFLNLSDGEVSYSSLSSESDFKMIGHPLGMPMIETGLSSVSTITDEYFFSKTDSFYGNSGSPIIDIKGNKVIGMHIGGDNTNSFIYDKKNDCLRYNRCVNSECYDSVALRGDVIYKEIKDFLSY